MTVATSNWPGLEEGIGSRRPKTVRPSAPIVFKPGEDFFRTDRGITWGIKVTDAGDIQAVHVFEQSGASWVVGTELAGLSWQEQVKSSYGGDMKAWFKATALPKLNAWLAQRFPPVNTPKTMSEQLDSLIVKGLSVREVNGAPVAFME